MTTRAQKAAAGEVTIASVLRELSALPSDRKVEVALGLLRAGGDGRQRVGVQLLRLAALEIEERAELRAALPKDRQALTDLAAAIARTAGPRADDVYPPDRRYHGD